MNKLFNALTETDKHNIVEFIKDTTQWNYKGDNLEKVFSSWAKNKEELFNAFGERLILSRDYELTNPHEVERKITDLWFGEAMSDLAHSFTDSKPFNALFCEKALAANLLDKNLYTYHFERDKDYFKTQIRYDRTEIDLSEYIGMKPMKALKRINKRVLGISEERFENLRLEHSLALNQKGIKGKLHLSIHPLDYMTMSDNDSGWSSCMSWRDDGEFHSGTIEMMNSPYVVIAYFTSDDNKFEFGSDGVWNNKKWRQLFIVHPTSIVSVKAYPYHNPYVSEYVCGWLKELFPDRAYAETGVWFGNGKRIENDKHYPHFYCDGHMYCDFTSCTPNHFGYFTEEAYEVGSIDYSGDLTCITCGEPINMDDQENYVTCSNCGPERHVAYCEDCGERLYEDQVYTDADGYTYCEYCYHERYFYCDSCGEEYNRNDVNRYEIVVKAEGTTRQNYYSICEHCYEKIEEYIGDSTVINLSLLDKEAKDALFTVIEKPYWYNNDELPF